MKPTLETSSTTKIENWMADHPTKAIVLALVSIAIITGAVLFAALTRV